MKNDDFSNRGVRLKEERKRLGINTQDELAEILGVAKNSIGRFEKHNAPLDTDYLDRLEDNGFDIEYILWGRRKVDFSGSLTDEEQTLLSIYRGLDEGARKGLIVIAQTYAGQSH